LSRSVATLAHGLLGIDAASDLPEGYIEPTEAQVTDGVHYGADGALVGTARRVVLSTGPARGIMDKLATLMRATNTGPDGHGQAVQTWASVGTVRVRIWQTGAGEPERELGEVEVSNWRCMAPRGCGIEHGDRLVVAGQTYDVLSVDPQAGRGHHLEAELRMVRG
jgi:hypothetical protein